MGAVLKFRPHGATLVVSYDHGNWRRDLFDEECSLIGTRHLACVPHLYDYISAMRDDGWRLLFGDGTGGMRAEIVEAFT
ncbi:hypothetical protein [Lichenibacterium ramalinae]|nr:hypothetical protein [Lichenibacterium ramalinae]